MLISNQINKKLCSQTQRAPRSRQAKVNESLNTPKALHITAQGACFLSTLGKVFN